MSRIGKAIFFVINITVLGLSAAGSSDDYCKPADVGTGDTGPFPILRLNFAGRFLADVSTYNNYPSNFNIRTFDPLENTGWNPKGTGDFRLVNCTVTQVCLANGRCVENDPLIGRPITGSDSTTAGKLVDLDTDDQIQSQIWGLVLGVDGFLKGDFKPRSFNHMHGACEGPGCGKTDLTYSAVFLSILQNVKWINGPRARQSNFMQQVMALRCMPGFQLYVKLNVHTMTVNSKSPDFPYGRVVGTIYAAVSENPLHYGPYKRMLWRDDGGHVPFYVDTLTKQVVLDFANGVKFNIKGDLVESPPGEHLYLIQHNETIQGCELLDNKAYNLGQIKLGSNDWFQMTAGIIDISVQDAKDDTWIAYYFGPSANIFETIGSTPLSVIRQTAPTKCETVLAERQDGLFVDVIDDRVMRKEPNSEWNVAFRTFEFGSSAEGIVIKTNLTWPKDDSKPAIDTVRTQPSGKNGISTITLRSSNPGEPRREQQLDGQVYGYNITAKKGDNGAEFLVRDLVITVLLYSEYTFTPGNVTWYEHVYPIFQQYANLYPVMKPIIDLASYEDVSKKRRLLKHALTLPETNPNYMPVTRDLSPQKRKMILSWIDDPDLTGLLKVGRTTHTVDELKRALQIALQIELATIPPYLSALFSIKDGNNRKVVDIIRSIVIEEMKHMSLVANILNAVGGSPVLNQSSVVPSYPAPLPGGANPGLVVTLARCSLNQIQTVFKGIERPTCKLADSDVAQYLRKHRESLIKYSHDNPLEKHTWAEIEQRCRQSITRPQTIGAIYINQILCPMVILEKETQMELFTGNKSKQITSKQWFSTDTSPPFPVHNLRSAVAAILDIATEGEGSDPCDPFDEENKLSHYFKFAEIVHGRKLIEQDPNATSSGQCFDDFYPCDTYGTDPNCTKSFNFAGRLVLFYEDGVWPTISNPHTERYPPGSQVRKYSDQFNMIYTGLLKCIHEAFNGEPDKMKDCMGMMSSLTAWGKKLVQTPIDPDGDKEIGPNAAPTFEFDDSSY
ncbi:uncharacterized protein LOC144859304 isoform X2 [Branchiostoma floridae x Branchiostoma japonicum]